jgi:hypothetical protein
MVSFLLVDDMAHAWAGWVTPPRGISLRVILARAAVKFNPWIQLSFDKLAGWSRVPRIGVHSVNGVIKWLPGSRNVVGSVYCDYGNHGAFLRLRREAAFA